MTFSDLVTAEKTRTQSQVCGRHILALQDTTELNFESHADRTTGLGTVGNGTDAGVFLHPMLAVDAASGAALGFGHIYLWNRLERAPEGHWNYPIEEKESYRWLASAIQSKQTLSDASMITFIADRESDIYELYDRIPGDNVHVLNRVRSDRKLNYGKKLYQYLDSLAPAGEITIKLPREIRQKRLGRTAHLSVRYGEVDIVKPQKCRDQDAEKSQTLRVVEVIELNCPAGIEPIHWRLLTTHTVNSF